MEFEDNIKEIRRIFSLIVDGKDSDVHLTFRGYSHGITKPWVLKIDVKEVVHEDHEQAAVELLLLLKKELAEKISNLEKQASHYRKALGSFNN